MGGIEWTQERCDRLSEAWEVGASATLVANQLSQEWGVRVTRNMVIGKVHRLRLKGRTTEIAAIPKPRKVYKPRGKPIIRRKATKMRENDEFDRIAKRPVLSIPKDPRPIRSELWRALPDAEPVTLDKLREHQCKWPIGDDLPFTFCGKPTEHGPYCSHHHTIAFTGVTSANPKGRDVVAGRKVGALSGAHR
jgi:GcrA cell cycle regulator